MPADIRQQSKGSTANWAPPSKMQQIASKSRKDEAVHWHAVTQKSFWHPGSAHCQQGPPGTGLSTHEDRAAIETPSPPLQQESHSPRARQCHVMSCQHLKASSGPSGAASGSAVQPPMHTQASAWPAENIWSIKHVPRCELVPRLRPATGCHCQQWRPPCALLTQGLAWPVQRGVQVVKHLQLIRRPRQHPIQLSVGGDISAAPQGALAVILQQGSIRRWVCRTVQAASRRACPASPFRECLLSLCTEQ